MSKVAALSMLGTLGFAVAVICIASGVFLLHRGITTLDMNQVLGGAALLSVGLVSAFLSVKNRKERRDAYVRGRRRGRWHRQ